MREAALNFINFTPPFLPESGTDSGLSPAHSTGMNELVSAARALLRVDDLHLDNRAEKAALRAALRRVESGRQAGPRGESEPSTPAGVGGGKVVRRTR